MKQKMKTHKLLARRVKITATGKVLHGSNGKRHLGRNKSKSQKRKMRKTKEFRVAYNTKVKKMLGVKCG
ncbi:50S ribosomal protein L35 [Candidatus Shapirobacteria bacterium CG09_land_8_20_14_0_10_39_12]|uniref:Large ribosomal subunit protein bL35 n=1 Tax=Candidatus Shapirobacteria bacterium CG09_land_8_20_14_0_10_39_12 TaxID=1974885 RepID=A0A2H0WPX5_9BACT|nr:MAG: 50S ribosomal protein L35 [Candidatus Shapirobacteria bacterium CG09_land_8_20_14_0_10_39_12]